MDLDDFEFRPLTQGLGFDKTTEDKSRVKAKSIQNQVAPPLKRHSLLDDDSVISSLGVSTKKLGQSSTRHNSSLELDQASQFPRNNTVFDSARPELEPTIMNRSPLGSDSVGASSNPGLSKNIGLGSKDFIETPEAAKPPVSRSLKKMLDSLPPPAVELDDSFKVPAVAPTKPVLPQQEPAPATQYQKEFDVTLNDSLAKAFPKEETTKPFFHQTVTPITKFKEIHSSFASAFIDGLFCILLSSLFLVTLVWFTGVDIMAMLISQKMGLRAMIEIGLLSSGVTLIYYMLSRGLFGSTLGDWAFDVQLGTAQERNHLMYPFQVLFRTFVIMVTGLIVVPLVSIGFGKDIAYYFSGLRLYSRQY